MAASSSNQESFIVEVGEEYPYPSHVIAPHFVTVKLSSKDKYDVWKTQMLCLLRSHGMLGFIDGTFVSPYDDQKYGNRILAEDMKNAWMRSDSLVTGWILGSLSEEVAMEVVNCLNSKLNDTYFTAKDAWDELQHRYGPSIAVNFSTQKSVDEEEEETKMKETKAPTNKENSIPEDEEKTYIKDLHFWIQVGVLQRVRNFLHKHNIKPTEKITVNGNTILHLAVRHSRANHEILNYLLALLKDDPLFNEETLSKLVNSDGSNLLHVAAIFGNTEAARILLKEKPDLLLAKDKDGHTPLALSLSNMHTKTSRWLIDHIKSDEEKKDTLFSGKSGDELLVLAISSENFGLAKDLLAHYETIHSDAVLMAIAQNFPPELKFWGRIRDREDIIYRLLDFGYFNCTGLHGCFCGLAIHMIFVCGFKMIEFCFGLILSYIVWPFIRKRVGVLNDASDLVRKVCQKIYEKTNRSDDYYLNPVFEATRLLEFKDCQDQIIIIISCFIS